MLNNIWLSVCVFLSDLIGDFYSKVSLGMSTMVVWLGGLNWNMIFMVIGFLMGLFTMGINWYYKHRNSKVFAEGIKKAAEKGYILNEPKE